MLEPHFNSFLEDGHYEHYAWGSVGPSANKCDFIVRWLTPQHSCTPELQFIQQSSTTPQGSANILPYPWANINI